MKAFYGLRNIKKQYAKMSLVIPENSKNCQNHGLLALCNSSEDIDCGSQRTAYLRMLLQEDAYNGPGDFGHEHYPGELGVMGPIFKYFDS